MAFTHLHLIEQFLCAMYFGASTPTHDHISFSRKKLLPKCYCQVRQPERVGARNEAQACLTSESGPQSLYIR